MSVVNQPFQGQLGTILIDELGKNYSSFVVFSAFAKNSGVLRLKSAIEAHKEKGGKVSAFIGVDLDGTSYEALLNLLSLCDELYVIHSENPASTYHSKIYLLESADRAWCAVGSNNLTGGGLWTNFESCNIENYSLPDEQEKIDNIYKIMEKYTDPGYVCSKKISSIDDIDGLLAANYISKEVTQKMEGVSRHFSQHSVQNNPPIFGTERVFIPSITIRKKDSAKSGGSEHAASPDEQSANVGQVKPAFTNEQFWFEMRASTGGSRNILDLSKLGKIIDGAVDGTPYEYAADRTRMYGGVKFFEIDPEDIGREKNITINYQGRDYYPSTVLFAPDNGSWRIQLKGSPSDGTDELSKFGSHGDFVHKILVFEKINPDYYVLSLLEESELDRVKSLSRVWARNGRSATAKAYGML